MKFYKFFILLSTLIFINFNLFSKNQVRIKDIILIDGLRENQLMGIGLITGLNGRGDSNNFKLTGKMLLNLAANHGYNINSDDLKSKNVASVLVTAKVGPFSRPGDLISVSISSIGDARSLEGGVLLQTALKAADGNIYAVAQGKIIAGNREQNSLTTASIPDGAIIEREITSNYIIDNKIRLILKYPDFVTANQIREAILTINPNLKINSLDAGMIEITLTENELTNPVNFIAQLEVLTITPDYVSSVVIDKKTGVIVVGEDIVIQNCSISTPFAQVTVGNNRNTDKNNNFEIQSQTIGELVKILNDAGLKTDEIISLIEAIHKVGAINAKLIIL